MRALIAVALLAGCGSSWTTPKSDLDRVVLSVTGSGPRDVWFVGGGLGSGPGALAMRFDGASFSEVATGAQETLWWVWMASPNEVWTVGEKGTILRWNGSGFDKLPSGTGETLYGIWGASPSEVWAVGGTPGKSSVLLRWDGAAWAPAAGAPQIGGALFKVWGAAANEVFAVGQGGTILRWDGAAWATMASGVGPNVSLFTVAGRARDDVYAVGGLGQGVALHYDGKAWGPVAGLNVELANGLTGVYETAAGDVAISGLGGVKIRGAAGMWIDDSRIPPWDDFHATWIAGPGDIFAVGGNYNAPPGVMRTGVIARYK